MGIADLPDIDEDDWRNYQADTFRRQSLPLSNSAAFMASTAPLLSAVDQVREQAMMAQPEPPPVAPAMPGLGGLGLGAPSAPNPFAPQAQDQSRQPYFGSQQTTAPDLFDELSSFDGDDEDVPSYKQAPMSTGSGMQQMSQEKPGFFSWAGEQVGGAAKGLRESGFSQTPFLGPVVTGGVQAASNVLHGLGGSAEAIRQGNLLGGVAGTAGATLNALGDIPREMATEAQWPTQISSAISPETPFLGGLNNPRELVGLGTDLLIPETALERLVGKGLKAAARPVVKTALEGLEPVGRAIGGTGTLAERGDGAMRTLESPYFSPARTGREIASDIGVGTAGGIAGAATADEDATWQERLGRGVVGAGVAAMGGPLLRSDAGVGGVLRKLAGDETGEANLGGALGAISGSGGRRYRREIPEGYEDLWDAMTPRQRRSARDASEAGTPYQPNVERIEAQRAMPEAQRIQQEIAEELPHMAPSEDPLPMAETSGDVTARVAGELSPMGKEKVLEQASNFFSKKNAPWLKGMIERTAGEGGEGTERYDRILELTTGEQSVGQLIEEAADEADQGIPQLRMTKRMRERQGNLRSMENVPDFLQAQLKRERDGAVKQLVKAHGGMTDVDAVRAADTIMEHIGQFAKNAKPNEPVSQVLLRAGREARAAIQLPKYLAEEEYQKLLADPNVDKATLAIAEEARDHWDYLSRVMSLYAGETAPSEIGRAFRSMRDKPRGSLSVEGGTFKPGERLPSGEEVPGTNKGKLTADEQAYQKELQQRRADLSGVPDDGTDPTNAKRLARTRNRIAGKRPDGPMNDLGLEWSDIFRRDPDDSLQRAKMMAGLEDIGGYRMRRDWVPRMMGLDLDDEAAVKKFWADARTAAGLDENSMPLVDFDPDISGQSYLGAVDTLTKNDAMTLVNRTLMKDADTAVKTLRRLQREGAPSGDIKAAQDEVRAALARTGLDIESFPENQLPILAKVAEGLGSRIEREWPEDRVAKPGERGAEEDVAKKRQLLGLFDQGIKKEQKLAGLPVTGIQDFLSFGTSNVLMTPRYLQAATLESAMNMINAPWQSVLRGNYGAAKQQLLGIARAFNLPTSEDLLKLGEGIKAPAMVNAMRSFTDIPLGAGVRGGAEEKALGIGRLQSTAELRDISNRTGFIRSDSPNALAKLLTPMHRLTRGMSEAFQTGSYFGEVARLAKDAAENGVLPGGKKITKILDETGEFRYPSMEELYGNLPKEIVDEALKTSKVITEGGHADIIEKQFGQWKGLLNKPGSTSAERTLGIFANLMFPFVYGLRPAIRMGFETATSPIVHPIQGIRALARGDKGEAAYIAKKFALASSFNGYIAYNVMGGNITGHGPNDPDARQALMEATDKQGDPVWRPDSVRLPSPDGGHFWVKYTSMPGAISMVATVMANAFEGYVYDGKPLETPPETAQRIALGVGTSFMDNTYFRDFMDLATAMNSTGGANTVQRLLGQIGGRFVPGTGALRLAAQLTDPKQRLSSGVVEDVMAGIPGLRQQLPTMKSPYTGQDVEMPLSPATALGGLSGNVYGSPSEAAQSPVANEVAGLSRRTSLPWEPNNRPADVAGAQVNPRTFTRGEQARGAEFQGLRQTPEAIRGAQAAFGAETQEDLLPLLQSPAYQALPPEQKAARIEAAMKGAAKAATYEATGAPGVQLKPEAQIDRAMMGQPMFRGQDEGSPKQNAEMNQKIIAAQNALSQLTQRYGRRQAIILMDEQAPEMLELALIYKKYNPDVRWMMEQESRESMGIPQEAPSDVYIPDYGGGAGTTVPTQTNTLTGGSLPPTFRRRLG